MERVCDPDLIALLVAGRQIVQIWGSADQIILDLDNGWSLVLEADESEIACHATRQ